jgi:hypothetical protein
VRDRRRAISLCIERATIGRASNGRWFLARALQTPNSEAKLTRKPGIRALAGIVTFTLPVLVAVIGVRLDHSTLRQDPRYAALVLPVLVSSVGLAAVVPAVPIMTSKLSWPRRIGLTVAMLCLLALECGLAGYIVLVGGVH